MNIIFTNNDLPINIEDNEIFENATLQHNQSIEKNVKFIEIIGNGSYGTVYKISIDNNYYALKITKNEIPSKLQELYTIMKIHLNNHIIQYYCAGKIHEIDGKEMYYSIMEYGIKTLHNYNFTSYEMYIDIFRQLNIIISTSKNNKLLIPDLKIANLIISKTGTLKIIDFYMFCKSYSPCKSCKLIRTYSAIENEHEKHIYESHHYNFTGIYIPFVVLLIELMCKKNIHGYSNDLCKLYDIKIKTKQLLQLLQIACFNYNNTNSSSIKKYKKLYKFKKQTEDTYFFLKTNEFYESFINLLEPKHILSPIITKKSIALIVNGLLNLNPEQRTIKYFYNIIK